MAMRIAGLWRVNQDKARARNEPRVRLVFLFRTIVRC
jgi:hypothetical protein